MYLIPLNRAERRALRQAFQYELILESRRRPELRPLVDKLYSAYRQTLQVELERADLGSDDSLVHLVFAALDGLVFQQTASGDTGATRRSLDRLRELLRTLQRETAS